MTNTIVALLVFTIVSAPSCAFVPSWCGTSSLQNGLSFPPLRLGQHHHPSRSSPGSCCFACPIHPPVALTETEATGDMTSLDTLQRTHSISQRMIKLNMMLLKIFFKIKFSLEHVQEAFHKNRNKETNPTLASGDTALMDSLYSSLVLQQGKNQSAVDAFFSRLLRPSSPSTSYKYRAVMKCLTEKFLWQFLTFSSKTFNQLDLNSLGSDIAGVRIGNTIMENSDISINDVLAPIPSLKTVLKLRKMMKSRMMVFRGTAQMVLSGLLMDKKSVAILSIQHQDLNIDKDMYDYSVDAVLKVFLPSKEIEDKGDMYETMSHRLDTTYAKQGVIDGSKSGNLDLAADEEVYMTVFKLLDTNNDKILSFEEFQTGLVLLKRRIPKTMKIKDVKQLFNSVDEDGSGGLDFDEFMCILEKLHRVSARPVDSQL